MYVIMPQVANENEPQVVMVGTEQEVKSKMFQMIDSALTQKSKVRSIDSEYGYHYRVMTIVHSDDNTARPRMQAVEYFLQSC